jgi:AraC family transcriptional regulator
MPGRSIRYLAGIRDEIVNHVGHSVVSEMSKESATGRLFVETASLMLAAHLLRTHGDSGSCKSFESTAHRLDHARLRRVLDHISVHLADEITVPDLAHVAGLSTFHFAQMFTLAVGISPNRYVSRLRLEQAMADAAAGKLSLAQIAFKSGFSSQASFRRAFRRATGITPGEYRSYRR